ncbi:MAG: hypothetical protein GX251_02895 [Firmicutes bacterium]|nr:hypothetical protein [Bacillota bacterium]
MFRKSLIIVFALVVVFSFSSLGLAQEYWDWNKFDAQYEKFTYEITSYTTQWDWEIGEDVPVEVKQLQTVELERLDEETTELTMAYTYHVSQEELAEQLGLMGFNMSWIMGGGEWLGEFMLLGFFASDLELEVGNSMQVFDGSRVRVVEKQTVAGVEGYLCRKTVREEDEEGNRIEILNSEWVIAPKVGWPLLVRVYRDDQVVYVMELVEYSRKD